MTNPNTAPSAAQPTKESPSPNYRPCKDAAPADYPPLTDEEINAEIARLDENGYLYTDRRPHAFFFAGANFARTQLADRAQRSGVSADPLPRPLLTDLEIQGLRRQARNDPRCADQHWFILMVRAIESYYGVTGAAAQSQPLVEPTAPKFAPRMDIYSRPGTPVIFDADGGYPAEKELAKKVLVLGNTYVVSKIEVGNSSTKVWIKGQGQGYNEYFNSVLFAASPQHQVKKGESS